MNSVPSPMSRRQCLAAICGLGCAITACHNPSGSRRMQTEMCTLEAKVLNHWTIERFSGEAILAAVKPRFVVALLIAGTKSPFTPAGSNVTLTTHRVVLFAIDSITKVFEESDVLGKTYRLSIEQSEIEGRAAYSIRVA